MIDRVEGVSKAPEDVVFSVILERDKLPCWLSHVQDVVSVIKYPVFPVFVPEIKRVLEAVHLIVSRYSNPAIWQFLSLLIRWAVLNRLPNLINQNFFCSNSFVNNKLSVYWYVIVDFFGSW